VTPILTALVGNNADLFPRILELYIPVGSIIADTTWGKGAFWKNVDVSKYDLKATDLLTGTDFRNLPYADRSIDALVIDPPYMHAGSGVHPNLQKCYNNSSVLRGHESIIRLYAAGILEAARVLKQKGIIIVKCQDETESGKQCWSHMELTQLLTLFGFQVVDLFVLQQTSIPLMREKHQKSARKSHSYFLVGRFRR
jgi:tRNA G10  N-methylase Trm11